MERDITQEDKVHLSGFQNILIRYYYYVNRGLDIVNQFRNLFLGIITVYIALHLTNILWGIVMFAVSIPILLVAGWYNTHKVLKKSEWLGTRFSTTYGIKQFDYSKRSVELLEEMVELLREQKIK